MLHILLFILKIIGIILAAILGILVLVICIVLFVPVRYEAALKCDGTLESLKSKVTITWFLHLIRVDLLYKSGQMRKRIRIAWKSITNGSKNAENKKETSGKKEAKHNEEKSSEKVSGALEKQKETAEEVKTIQTAETTYEKQESKSIEEKCESNFKKSGKNLEEEQTGHHKEKQTDGKTSSEKGCRDSEKTENIFEKITHKIEAMKDTLKNCCDKIKSLLKKKDKISEFIQDDNHIAAFQKVKKEIFFLLRKWKPRKAKIRVHYGFEDPCTTGQVLAGLSVIYPFLGDDLVIEPDFGQQIFRGNIYLKGKIRCSHLAGAAVRLLISKKVRTSLKDIKEFKL